jgi:hypothetical protein
MPRWGDPYNLPVPFKKQGHKELKLVLIRTNQRHRRMRSDLIAAPMDGDRRAHVEGDET